MKTLTFETVAAIHIGGSYIAQKDGTLKRDDKASTDTPDAQAALAHQFGEATEQPVTDGVAGVAARSAEPSKNKQS